VMTQADLFFAKNLATGDVATLGADLAAPTITSIDQLGTFLTAQIQNRFAARWMAGTYEVTVDESGGAPTLNVLVVLEDALGNRQQCLIESHCWFLQNQPTDTWFGIVPTTSEAIDFVNGDRLSFLFTPNEAPNPWLVIRPELDNDGEPGAWPASGYLLAESNDGLEVVTYDSAFDDPMGQLKGVRVSGRALMGTPRIDLFAAGTRVTVVSGLRGTLQQVVETVATSSGTGLRGVYDTLAFGLGLSMPGDWFDLSGFPVSSQYIDAASDEAASVENLVGGWLALMGRCLTQRRNAAGYVRISAESTSLDVPGTALSVLESDILVGATKAERLFESPNVVRIEDSLRQKRIVTVVRDVPRQQAEGARAVTFIAPGINTASALAYGGKMLAMSDGQLVITFGVRPGLDLQIGDPCRLDFSHPAVWSWEDGSASAVAARVIGESFSLATGERSLTFLIPGQQQLGTQLCPAARIDGYLSSTVLDVDDVTGFAAGMSVFVYRRANIVTSTTRTIASVDADALTVTLATALSSVTFPSDGDSYMTYADYGTGTASQDEHLFMNRGSFVA